VRFKILLGLIGFLALTTQAIMHDSELDAKIYSLETEETMANIGKVKLKAGIVDNVVEMTADEAADLTGLLGNAEAKASEFDTERSHGLIEMVLDDKKITISVNKVKKDEDEQD